MLKRTIFAILPPGVSVVSNSTKKYPYPMLDIVNRGREGFQKNRRNPFPSSSHRYKEWERGYNKAYYENLERLENNND